MVLKCAVAVIEFFATKLEVNLRREVYSLFCTTAAIVLMVPDDSTCRRNFSLPRAKICIYSSSLSVAASMGGGDKADGGAWATAIGPSTAGRDGKWEERGGEGSAWATDIGQSTAGRWKAE